MARFLVEFKIIEPLYTTVEAEDEAEAVSIISRVSSKDHLSRILSDAVYLMDTVDVRAIGADLEDWDGADF